jgi:hypothetical protein
VKQWADDNGKTLTQAQVNQIKAKYKEYVARGSDPSKRSSFNDWFKSEVDAYWGGWNPASNIRGII